MLVFWVLTPCGLEADTNVSEEHTVSIFRAQVKAVSHPKHWYQPTSSRVVLTQNANVDIFTAFTTLAIITTYSEGHEFKYQLLLNEWFQAFNKVI
jgi:hypothetical protein